MQQTHLYLPNGRGAGSRWQGDKRHRINKSTKSIDEIDGTLSDVDSADFAVLCLPSIFLSLHRTPKMYLRCALRRTRRIASQCMHISHSVRCRYCSGLFCPAARLLGVLSDIRNPSPWTYPSCKKPHPG